MCTRVCVWTCMREVKCSLRIYIACTYVCLDVCVWSQEFIKVYIKSLLCMREFKVNMYILFYLVKECNAVLSWNEGVALLTKNNKKRATHMDGSNGKRKIEIEKNSNTERHLLDKWELQQRQVTSEYLKVYAWVLSKCTKRHVLIYLKKFFLLQFHPKQGTVPFWYSGLILGA